MIIQKQRVMNHATLKPQLWPFFIILRGWEQELSEKQKLTSTLHSSLMWGWGFSLAIPIHPFFLCLLFSSSFQKTSPQWISLKRDSLPSDRWTPFLTLTFCLWALMTREVKYCWSNLERDLAIVACWHTPPCLRSAKHLARKKNPAKKPWNPNKQLQWKSISETAAGDPVLDSWITWAGATSHALLSTLTLCLLEQFSCLWKRTRVCCIFILSHCHYILTVLRWAQASITVTPLQARKEESSRQTWLATRFWLLCALGLLCSIDVCRVTRLAGGFLKQKKTLKRHTLVSIPTVRTSLVVLQLGCSTCLHRCCLSYLTLVLFISDNRGMPNTEAQTNMRGHQKLLFSFQDNFNHFFTVFSAGPESTTSVIKGP